MLKNFKRLTIHKYKAFNFAKQMLSQKNTRKGKKSLRVLGCGCLTGYVLNTSYIKIFFCSLYCLPVLVLAPIFNRVRFALDDPVFCFSNYISRVQVNGVIFARLNKFLKSHGLK